MNAAAQQTSDDKTAIHPFQVNVPEAKIAKLRGRINATEWPDRETVSDESQGVQLATMQELARYWATDYDWRKCEAKLNSLPHFMTEIDGFRQQRWCEYSGLDHSMAAGGRLRSTSTTDPNSRSAHVMRTL